MEQYQHISDFKNSTHWNSQGTRCYCVISQFLNIGKSKILIYSSFIVRPQKFCHSSISWAGHRSRVSCYKSITVPLDTMELLESSFSRTKLNNDFRVSFSYFSVYGKLHTHFSKFELMPQISLKCLLRAVWTTKLKK